MTRSSATVSGPGAPTPASRSRRSTSAEALRREPRLHPGVQRAFAVPDGVGRHLAAGGGLRRGRRPPRRHRPHLPRCRRGDRRGRPRLRRAVRDTRTGAETEVRAQITVSATGAWAGRLAAMAGCTVHVRGGRGVMVALNHRLVPRRPQPLPDAHRRRHPRAGAHGVGDRDDRHAGRGPRRPQHPRGRRAQAARRGLRARAAHPRRAGAAGLGRVEAALQRAPDRHRHTPR